MPFDENPTVEITDLGGDNTGDRVKFTLRNCELPIANALRRVMIAEVSE
jgi:DNA-directed RNA polymerase alpha subunit